MLRKTIYKIKQASACPKLRLWRGLADDKSKYEPFTEQRQRVRWNSSDARGPPPDDELPDKWNTDRTYGTTYEEMEINKLYMKDKETTSTSKEAGLAPNPKCQRIISEIFKEAAKKDGSKSIDGKAPNIPKSNEDFNLKSMSKPIDDEGKLTQKIEKIKEVKEVPIVEAQHIEEFGTTPKTLNTIKCDQKMGGYTYIDKALDDLATQCLHAAPTQIDDNLLDGMNKLLYKSVDTFSSDKINKPGQVKPKAGTTTKPTPPPKLKKKSKEPIVEDPAPKRPTLKDDTIPHPGTFLFTHINYGSEFDSYIIDPISSKGQGTSGQMKNDLVPHPCTYLFDQKNLDLNKKHDNESYLQFGYYGPKANTDICTEDQKVSSPDAMLMMQAIDFWEDAHAQRTPAQQSVASAAYFEKLCHVNRKKFCDDIAHDFYETTDSKGKTSGFLQDNNSENSKTYDMNMKQSFKSIPSHVKLKQSGRHENRQEGCDEIPSGSHTLVNNNDFSRAPVKYLKNNSQEILTEKLKNEDENISSKSAATMEDISLLHKIRKQDTHKQHDAKNLNDTQLNIGCHYLLEELENEKQTTSKSNKQDSNDRTKTVLSDLSIPHPCVFLFRPDSLDKGPGKHNSESSPSTKKANLPKDNDDASSTKVEDSALRHPCTYLFGYNIPDLTKDHLERYSPFMKNVHKNAWIFDKVSAHKRNDYVQKFSNRPTHNDPPKKPETPSPVATFQEQKASHLDRYAIKNPKSRIIDSTSTVQPIVDEVLQESQKPTTVIMQESKEVNEPNKDAVTSANKTEQKEDLVKRIASHPSNPNRFKRTAKRDTTVWGEIVNSKDLNSLERLQRYGGKNLSEKYPYVGFGPSQVNAPPSTQRNIIDDSTFEPPSVVFETDPFTTVKQQPNPAQHISIDQASKTLIVSSEIDENSKWLNADSRNKDIEMPLPKGNLESSSQTLVFKRDDPVNKTNLHIQMDKTGSPLSKEFDKAKEIFIKLSDQDMSKNKVLSKKCLMIHELEIITQDNTNNSPVSKKYVSKSHVLQLDGATSTPKSLSSTDELLKMEDLDINVSITQINEIEQHLQRLDQIINNLIAKAGSGSNSCLKLLMQKLQEKRKLENFLQYIYQNQLQFAECGKRDRPECPPVACPPKPRCPRIKKQRRLNRSTCKSSDCSATKCNKKTTCKSKSKSFVCEDSPPKPKSPCVKCVAFNPIESGNEMVCNQLFSDEYLIELLNNIPKCFGKSLKDQLPIFTSLTPLSPYDEEQLVLPRRKSCLDFWNYKNFDPWVPIPSYEKPKEEKKRFFRFPKSPCKQLPPTAVDPNRPKSKTFPRLSLSVTNFLFVTKKY